MFLKDVFVELRTLTFHKTFLENSFEVLSDKPDSNINSTWVPSIMSTTNCRIFATSGNIEFPFLNKHSPEVRFLEFCRFKFF